MFDMSYLEDFGV